MSRKVWTILGIVLLAVLIVAAGGAVAVYGYLRYTDRAMLSNAEAAEAAQNWRAVKNNCAWYLTRHPKDAQVLAKYAEACSKSLDSRNANVRDTGRAYFQIASRDAAQPDVSRSIHPVSRSIPADEPILRLVDFQEKHHLWGEMEYATSYFLRQRSGDSATSSSSPQDQDRYRGLDARLRYLHALALERAGRTKEAVDGYTELINAGTEFVDAYGSLALLLQQQGLTEQAQTVMKQAEERFPDHPHIFLSRARQLMAARSFAEAESAFQEALKRAPDDVQVLVEALDAALKTRRWDPAAAYADKLVKVAPDRQEGYLGLAFLFERKGEADKAIALLSGLDPRVRADNPELFLALAELQIATDRFDDLAQTLEAYKTSYPEHTAIFDYLAGRELMAKGMPSEAAAKLATVVESAPEFVRAQFYEAVAFMQSKQDDRAQGALESYLRNRPDDERAHALWQSRFGASTTREEAVNAGQTLLSNADAGSYSLVFAARSLMRYASLQDAKEADVQLVNQLLERAIKLQPGDSSAYQALAEFLINRKDSQGARQVLDRAEAAGTDKRELFVLRAAVALAEGNPDVAHGLLIEDLARPDLTPDEVTRWAEFLAGSGYLDKAIEALKLGAEKMNPEQRSEFEIEQLALTTRFGTTDRAMEIFKTIESQIVKTPALTTRLNQEKIAMARALLRTDISDPQESKEKALTLLKSVETEEPTNTGARVLRASLLLKQDPPDYAGAKSIVSGVLETSPSDVDALVLMSDIAAGGGRPAQALDYAQRAAAASPPGAQAQLALADAQLRAQRYREAQETLQRYIIARPNGTRAMEMLVRAYGEQGKPTEARATFDSLEKALADNPEKARILDPLRGKLAGYEGHWEEAERTLRLRQDANPDDMAATQSLAVALAKLNRYGEAEKLLKEFAERQHNRPEAWTLLGQFYLNRKPDQALEEASSAFTQASLLIPDYGPALRGLIEVQVRGNNRGTALSLCDRYLAAQPDDVDILYRKAVLLAQDRSRLDEALQTIGLALQISERPEFLTARGAIYLAQEKFSDALKDLQRYAEIIGSTSADVDMTMAEIYLALHEKDLAQQYYDSAKQKTAKAQTPDTARIERLGKKLEEESQRKP